MIKINHYTSIPPLKEGEIITPVEASSALKDQDKFIEGLEIFKSWGLNVSENFEFSKRWGYLAGSDNDRYKNLHQSSSSALLAFVRGGWGSARLLEQNQPWRKGWFLGFSDVTSLLFSRLSAGYDGCIHGPMITSLAEEPDWSKQRLQALLFGDSLPDIYGEPLNKGIAQGPLVAANLTVATHLIGTAHMPDLTNAILVLEDIGEEPYKIDRMLTHWRLAGILNNLAGLCFGDFINCESGNDVSKHETFMLDEILKDRIKGLDIPIITNLPVGHGKGNAALPLGKTALLNAEKGFLRIIPS